MKRWLMSLVALVALPVFGQSIECDVSRTAMEASMVAALEMHTGQIGKVAAAASAALTQRDQVIAGLTKERDQLLTDKANLEKVVADLQEKLKNCQSAPPPVPQDPQPVTSVFCTQMATQLGAANVLRCDDFSDPAQAKVKPMATATLYDGGVNATGGGGSIGWTIKSFNQVKAENPTWSNGQVWKAARDSHTGNWQRWFGRPIKAGETVWIQFKYRFNEAFKTRWGGGGPKVWGLDAGCRVFGGVMIPVECEKNLGTAGSMEITMTTTNWGTNPALAYPVLYQGSSNFSLTKGFTPLVQSSKYGTAQLEQNGDPTKNCNSLDRIYDPTWALTHCVTYGAADTWHTITIALRPSGNYLDTNPAVNTPPRHDTMLRVWYDDRLVWVFDPDMPTSTKTAEQCRASTELHPADCPRTGVDIFRDSRDKPPAGAWCVAPCAAGDPGADLSQLLLWTFSYRRGYPPIEFCNDVIGKADAAYNECVALSSSADAPGDFEAFLSHSTVRVNMDDVLVTTAALKTIEPLPPGPTPPVTTLPAPFEMDAKDIGSVPPMRFVRLWPGPDKVFYNTGYGKRPDGSLAQQRDTHAQRQECTNLMVEYPVQSGVPLGGGFHMPTYGNGKMMYFGGGHSGYMANRVNIYDVATGRWSQSQYTPDMGCWIGGAVGPRQPTPPGTGGPTDGVAFFSAPNGSAGGRGWWEHTDNRIAFDKKLGGWVMVQNSGTWLYNDVTEAWTQLKGPWPEGSSMVCGPGDYTSMGVVWSEVHQATFMWCSTERIWRWDYAKSDWAYVHALAQADRNPQTDVLSMLVEGKDGRLYMLRGQTTNLYTASETRPWIQWYDPATNTSGKLDVTKPNFPNGLQAPRDINTFAWIDPKHPCLVGHCQTTYATMVYDPVAQALMVLGKRTGDGKLILWKGTGLHTASESWSIIDSDAFQNAPVLLSGGFPLGMLTYIPERDAFMFTVRIGSGNGGASTRNAQDCKDPGGAAGDCFKMFGLKFKR